MPGINLNFLDPSMSMKILDCEIQLLNSLYQFTKVGDIIAPTRFLHENCICNMWPPTFVQQAFLRQFFQNFVTCNVFHRSKQTLTFDLLQIKKIQIFALACLYHKNTLPRQGLINNIKNLT